MKDSELYKSLTRTQEGGCGVVAFCSNIPIRGQHLLPPSRQMHNRGNGKGGGVVCMGFEPKQLGVTKEILDSHYLIQIAYLKTKIRKELEKEFIYGAYDVHSSYEFKSRDFKELKLEIEPPVVVRYFCKPKADKLKSFQIDTGMKSDSKAEDEYTFRNSYKLNKKYYASLGEKQAFVLSHGKNMMVFKIVGYSEQAIEYYNIEDLKAQIWIAHQRYPTKGRVWHPAGAHPFIGLNIALVHNGDFANYHAISEYLKQHNREGLFLTDTEVAALLFDYWDRELEYPLEYVLEAMAPTTERDFAKLPLEKQEVYEAIQNIHIQNSPDGPWFFIIGRNDAATDTLQLLGITDTSMLRPQVFAVQENDGFQIGLIASEKQAIDSILESISKEEDRVFPIADKYWNARGGSYENGGSFIFSIKDGKMECRDKFGTPIHGEHGKTYRGEPAEELSYDSMRGNDYYIDLMKEISYGKVLGLLSSVAKFGNVSDEARKKAIEFLTHLIDGIYDVGEKKRSIINTFTHEYLYKVFSTTPKGSEKYTHINYTEICPPPRLEDATLIINGRKYPPEGKESLASQMVKAQKMGWNKFIIYDLHGQRFIGCGFGMKTAHIRIDSYGSIGDYSASGISNSELHVHGNGQDQWAQIMKSGKLVVYGDVGQAFGYGAKGGECYIRGNAAGRPLINAVGKPRVVINGTCLDYLAESFMAGDPHNGGGFVVLNAIQVNPNGTLEDYPEPYPGVNLFSLASGGAIFIRDPYNRVESDQLNGGEIVKITPKDWELIKPYLRENEILFGITIDNLLTKDGILKQPVEIYRKVQVKASGVLH
jgi:glutamate synthase domain-containing protein 1/glutamate synthase domain-containing protein 3